MERDSRIIIDQTLKSSKQYAKAAGAVNAVLDKLFLYKSKELILQLYESLIRPKLEYCIQARKPYSKKKDITILEKVQKTQPK